MTSKWIKIDQSWHAVRGDVMERDWSLCERQGMSPVAKSFPGHVRIYEQSRPDVWPNYVLKDGWLIHQFHEIGVKVQGVGNAALYHANKQLQSLLAQLII